MCVRVRMCMCVRMLVTVRAQDGIIPVAVGLDDEPLPEVLYDVVLVEVRLVELNTQVAQSTHSSHGGRLVVASPL